VKKHCHTVYPIGSAIGDRRRKKSFSENGHQYMWRPVARTFAEFMRAAGGMEFGIVLITPKDDFNL
jgi:hypothetical protein